VITSVTNATVCEEYTTFTTKEIAIIAATWPDTWEDLASVLEVGIIPDDEEASNAECCSVVLQAWLKQSCVDKRKKLAEKFEGKGYPSIAEEITKLQ
jgi:hypothetical protein